MGKEQREQAERHPEVAWWAARVRSERPMLCEGREGTAPQLRGASATAGCDVVERRGGGFWAVRAPHVVETGIRLRIVSNRQQTRV